MARGFAPVADLARHVESMLSKSTQLVLNLIEWSWLNDKRRLDYFRFYEYGQGPSDRLQMRNVILQVYKGFLELDPPLVIKNRIREIIRELWSVPVGPYSSLLFVPDRWWNAKAAQLTKTEKYLAMSDLDWVRKNPHAQELAQMLEADERFAVEPLRSLVQSLLMTATVD